SELAGRTPSQRAFQRSCGTAGSAEELPRGFEGFPRGFREETVPVLPVGLEQSDSEARGSANGTRRPGVPRSALASFPGETRVQARLFRWEETERAKARLTHRAAAVTLPRSFPVVPGAALTNQQARAGG